MLALNSEDSNILLTGKPHPERTQIVEDKIKPATAHRNPRYSTEDSCGCNQESGFLPTESSEGQQKKKEKEGDLGMKKNRWRQAVPGSSVRSRAPRGAASARRRRGIPH